MYALNSCSCYLEFSAGVFFFIFCKDGCKAYTFSSLIRLWLNLALTDLAGQEACKTSVLIRARNID